MRTFGLACVLLTLGFSACSSDDDPPSNDPDNSAGASGAGQTPGNGGKPSTAPGKGSNQTPGDELGENTVTGVVTDVRTGARLAGVEVTVVGGDKSVTSDAHGEFAISGLEEGLVNLELKKEGYAPGFATQTLSGGPQTALVALKREGVRNSYDPTEAATLTETTDAGPYAVIFTPDSLDTEDTELHVSVTPLDPTSESAALPGDLIAGGDEQTPLAAVTFAEFAIYDSEGNRVNLKPSESAIVELPIPQSLRASYPEGSKIHCYSYNPESGKWEDFVEGTVAISSVDEETPVLRASVRHFSWYGGAPAVQDQTCAYVQVTSKVTGKPLAGATVTARPGLKAVTDARGFADVTVAANSQVKFFAQKTYTDTYVDDAGNLIPQKGSKVIEIGQVEDTLLVPLVKGPCTSGVSTKALGDPEDPIQIQTGLAPDNAFVYELTAQMVTQDDSTQLLVLLEQGVTDEEGELIEPEPTAGAIITLRGENGDTVEFSEGLGVPGFYTTASDAKVTPGTRYTLLVDADGNGTVDGSGSCYALATPEFETPEEGETYSASGFTAEWSEASPDAYYQVVFSGPELGIYAGTERSFTPEPELTPGEYTGQILAFSCLPQSSDAFNITGVGLRGQFLSYTTATTSFTLE